MTPGPSAPPRPLGRTFTKVRAMNFPRAVLAGHGVLGDTAEICRQSDLEGPCLVITGEQTKKVAGEKVRGFLEEGGFPAELVLAGEATTEELGRLRREVAPRSPHFLVGVGGGSKIDLAKALAAELGVPFVSVPTSAAHDGISSPRASLKGADSAASVEGAVPMAIVADTEVIALAPYRSLAAGCADVISNVTAVLDWRLARNLRHEDFSNTSAALAEYAAQEIMEHASTIRKGDEESVWVAIRPILMSGISMSMAGSSRPSSGAEHLFAHALERQVPGKALHGEMVGVGTLMMACLHGADWKHLRGTLTQIGAPVTARELGIPPEEIVSALVRAHTLRPERYTILGDHGLTPEAAERLARDTGVI